MAPVAGPGTGHAALGRKKGGSTHGSAHDKGPPSTRTRLDYAPTIPRRIICSAARWPNSGSPRIVVGSARMYGCPKKFVFFFA